MPKPILVANWKNHPNSLTEAKKLLGQLARKSRLYKKASLFIAPPLPFLDIVSQKSKSFAELASQDMPILESGAHTGEINPEILKSFGVRFAIIGHSERRAMGETSELLSKKVMAALNSGIAVLLCIGEKYKDQDGEHFEIIRDELKKCLSGIDKNNPVPKIAIAYEPVWAIGQTSEDAIDPQELTQSVVFIKKVLSDMFGRKDAERIPILYGGSVEPANARSLMKGSNVKGFLIGHASLDAKSFEIITQSILEK